MPTNSSPMPETELDDAEDNKEHLCTLGLYFHSCHGWERYRRVTMQFLLMKQHRVISTLKKRT